VVYITVAPAKLTVHRHACKVPGVNNEARLPKTQAATLATLRKLGQIEPGVQCDGINGNAVGPLVRKGFAEFFKNEDGLTRVRPTA
jgi:hypothetical protein